MIIQKRQLKKIKFDKNNLRLISESNGVYIFWGKGNEPIYIGKANNLKKRLESYRNDSNFYKVRLILKESSFFSIVRVTSELESLLVEAELVHTYKPKFNSQLKDDKSPLYIKITNDKYPLVLTARKKEERFAPNGKRTYFLGPFPNSSNVKNVLKFIRKIFPYSEHKPSRKACMESQIGLCNPCPSVIENIENESFKKNMEKIYINNIRLIKNTLNGNFKGVKLELEKEMFSYSEQGIFEKARELRDQIRKLDYITQPASPISYFLKNPNFLEEIRNEELISLKSILSSHFKFARALKRIECFDVAHLAGSYPTASMVTFIDGEPEKSYYRHFRIRTSKAKSDTNMMKEVFIRRMNHFSDWGIPDLIVVDGGKPQVSVTSRILNNKVPLIGLAKKFEKIVLRNQNGFFESRIKKGPALNLLQRIRDEAHRFSRRYHHKLISKAIIKP